MAYYTDSAHGDRAPHQHPEYSVAGANPITKLTNITGALVSLALVVGVGVWGYKLLVRDVSGVPVVRAAAGDMRVRPENPGGELATNQGLSVNKVAAIGSSEDRAEEVHLAPKPTDLAEEDQPMPEIEEAMLTPAPRTAPQAVPEPAVVTPAPAAPNAEDITAAIQSGSVNDLVAQLTQGVAPMTAPQDETVPVLASVAAQDISAAVISGGDMRVSLRPPQRPVRAAARSVAAAATPAAATAGELDAASLPAGTRLVQLGAFDTPEIARAQWGKLNARFAPFMTGKNRIVMEAKSGGRTFYRLRAQGFEDIGDARRFCSALVAESVDCIPVVTR